MTEEKKRLRREFKKIRDSIEKSVRASESERIIKNLIETEEYKSAKTVFAYVSFGSEVETYNLLKRILADGKRLAVPLCDTDSRIMSAICIDDLTQLVCGAYGIPEPPKDGIVLGKDEIDLVVVPALSFDRSGMRLGYGGGYYDKFLYGFKGNSAGLAFSQCIAESLPTDKFDCRTDRVICPEGVI